MKILTPFIIFIVIIISEITFGLQSGNFQIMSSRMRRFIPAMNAQITKMKSCDQSSISVMDAFNMSELLGEWYELGKTMSSYIDTNDGIWKITDSEGGNAKFLYSGRSSDGHCVRPISGSINPVGDTPGGLILHYRTFSTSVSETVRILYTDYTSIAVLYSCVHIIEHTGGCHPAGVVGSLWTRKPHVDVRTYDKALKYLESACIDQHTVRIRNIVGPCEIDNSGTEDEGEADLVHDICYQPVETGSCFANIGRFYYDKDLKQCKEFAFGGCNGNKNNFFSLQECEQHCLNIGENKVFPQCIGVSPCALHCPPCCRQTEDGCVVCDCQNIRLDESVECHDAAHCPENCPAEEIYPECYKCDCNAEKGKMEMEDKSICLEVKEVGSCDEETDRYFYNAIHSVCEKFRYSGCGANNNNFKTMEDCLNACKANHVEMHPIVDDDDDGSSPLAHAQILIMVFAHLFAFIFT